MHATCWAEGHDDEHVADPASGSVQQEPELHGVVVLVIALERAAPGVHDLADAFVCIEQAARVVEERVLGGAPALRDDVAEVVVERARGRCPVLAHTGHHSAAETIELTRHAAAVGADFAVVINPYYPPASDEGLYRWFAHVCGSVDIGMWLFDTGYSGVSLSTELIGRLAGLENVVGIKVGRDHDRYLELLAAFGDQILVCSPHEETWLENMTAHGQRVYMSSAAPYLYQTPSWQPMREYTRLALAGETAKAAEVAATLDPVRSVAAKWLQGHERRIDNIASIKAWAGLTGMSGGPVRPPLVSLTAALQAALADDLAAAGLR